MKKNWSLIIGLSIPVLLIIFIALTIYLPKMFVHPKVNFVYSTGDQGYYFPNADEYSVVNGVVVKNPMRTPEAGVPNPPQPLIDAKLYLYNVTRDTNTELTLDAAAKLHLSSNTTSSDGFTVTDGNQSGGDFFPFGGHSYDYNARFLQGHGLSNRLNINMSPANGYYYGNFHFLGWVE